MAPAQGLGFPRRLVEFEGPISPATVMGSGVLAEHESCLAGRMVDSRDYELPTQHVVLDLRGDSERRPLSSLGTVSRCG